MTETSRPETSSRCRRGADGDRRGRSRELTGGGSKRAFGRPSEADMRLDLSALSGIVLYEPGGAGADGKTGHAAGRDRCWRSAVNISRSSRRTSLACWTAAASGLNVRGTLGGADACRLGRAGIKTGAARDHVLGFHAVSGRGEPFKAGGRVVKNVTGFDLPADRGPSALAALTELTVRALPAPEETRTVWCSASGRRRRAAMTTALSGRSMSPGQRTSGRDRRGIRCERSLPPRVGDAAPARGHGPRCRSSGGTRATRRRRDR